MDIFGTLKSIAEAVKATIGWKSDSTQRKDEALKKNEERQRQLREELAAAQLKGDRMEIDRLRGIIKDES